MNFLAPLFLLGGLSLALPILFHLIRRTSKEQIPFSTLMFLQPTLPRVTKRNRLEHILLLLLRCLVLGLLALGFARPFLQQPWTAPLGADNGRRMIVLVDSSASMRREGLWPAAVAKAGEVLRTTSPADRVAVYAFDRQVHPVVSFEQWAQMPAGVRSAQAAQRLAGLQPSWAATYLGSALITAAETFTAADKQAKNPGPRRIVLLSDLQEGSRLEGLQGYDWPRGLDVQIEPIRPKRTTNAGLQWVQDNAEAVLAETNASPRLRVSNSADAKREQFQLRWEGVTGAAPLPVYVPPGQSRVVPAPILPSGTSADRVSLAGDDEDFDNTAYFVPPAAEQIQVLYLGNDAEQDATQPLFYLKRAFQQTRRQAVRLTAQTPASGLAGSQLVQTRLLVVADALPEGTMAAVRNFVAGGGTALWLLKDVATAQTLGKLAGSAGFAATDVKPTQYAMFGVIDFEHPLFAAFADPRYNDFTKIHFWKYRRLDAAQLPGARVLAKFDGGEPALLEIPLGQGRIFVLASGWQPADSQLALSSKFVPLLYALLDLASHSQAPGTQFQVGDRVSLASFTNSPQPVVIRKPGGAVVQLRSGEASFAETDVPGIYTVTSSQPSWHFAVNLEPGESRTAPLPIDQLERLGLPLKPSEIVLTKRLEIQRHLHNAELEAQQKLWRWLTLMALVVLLIETGLAGRLTRRAAQTEVPI